MILVLSGCAACETCVATALRPRPARPHEEAGSRSRRKSGLGDARVWVRTSRVAAPRVLRGSGAAGRGDDVWEPPRKMVREVSFSGEKMAFKLELSDSGSQTPSFSTFSCPLNGSPTTQLKIDSIYIGFDGCCNGVSR